MTFYFAPDNYKFFLITTFKFTVLQQRSPEMYSGCILRRHVTTILE